MRREYNLIHLLFLVISVFVTYSRDSKIVRRDFETLFFFNVALLIFSSTIQVVLDTYESAKRLSLWVLYVWFTAPIIFVCCRLLYQPGMTRYGVTALFVYSMVPSVFLGVQTVHGFVNFLKF